MIRETAKTTIIYWMQITCVTGGLVLILLWGLKREIAYDLYTAIFFIIFAAGEFYRRKTTVLKRPPFE